MPKVSLFAIKIGNKSWKTRKNLLPAKSAVIKTLRTVDRNGGERADGEFLTYDNNI